MNRLGDRRHARARAPSQEFLGRSVVGPPHVRDLHPPECGSYRPPIKGRLTPWRGNSHTPAPPGLRSAPILASIRYGLPLAIAVLIASPRSPAWSTRTPSIPQDRQRREIGVVRLARFGMAKI